MPRLIADENLHSDILRGLLRRNNDLDIVRVQDVGLTSAADPIILEWAAVNDRVLLTSDVKTFIRFSNERIAAGMFMPGVIIVPQGLSIVIAIDDILWLATCGEATDIENQVVYLPL